MFKPIYQQEKTSLSQNLIFSRAGKIGRLGAYALGLAVAFTPTTMWHWKVLSQLQKSRRYNYFQGPARVVSGAGRTLMQN
jgi:hypothetical protein